MTPFGALFVPADLREAVSVRAWLGAMLEAESAFARAGAAAGVVPSGSAAAITAASSVDEYDWEQLLAEARGAGTPAEPLVRALVTHVGEEHARWVHLGATSQDVMDTASMLVARKALGLVRGEVDPKGETLVRVHEPLSILDLLDTGTGTHSWSFNEALARIAAEDRGVMVLLNCSEGAGQLIERVSEPAKPVTPSRTSLLTYGIGAQILRELNVGRMRVLATPRKMPSMAGWELEIAGYESPVRSGAK